MSTKQNTKHTLIEHCYPSILRMCWHLKVRGKGCSPLVWLQLQEISNVRMKSSELYHLLWMWWTYTTQCQNGPSQSNV